MIAMQCPDLLQEDYASGQNMFLWHLTRAKKFGAKSINNTVVEILKELAQDKGLKCNFPNR